VATPFRSAPSVPGRARRLTTYSGHRAGFSSWWLHAKVLWTRNGRTSGAVNGEPHSLFDGGTAFNVYLEP
jgi:hypothetical protein